MKRSARVIRLSAPAIVAILCAIGCRPPEAIPGRLAIVEGVGGQLVVGTERVYAYNYVTIETYEVTGPHAIVKLGEVDSGFGDCFFPCSGFAVNEPLAVISASESSIAVTELPDGTQPKHYGVPGDLDIVSLSNGGFVAATAPIQTTAGTISFMAVSATNAQVVATIDELTTALDVVGNRVFATTVGQDVTEEGNYLNNLAIYDAETLDAPLLVASLPLPIRANEVITGGFAALFGSGISIDGDDLFAISGIDKLEFPCRLNWFTMNADLTDIVLVSETDASRAFCTTISSSSGYIFLGVSDDVGSERDETRVEVFRADPVDGLVQVFRYDLSSRSGVGGISSIEIDEELGLVYIAHSGDLHVMDLGVLTTGEPRWP